MNFCLLGLAVIETEAKAVFELTQRLDERFNQACEFILKIKGRVIVTGLGKSGHIANKIAATFASTGTPAFFLHPSEACHGDLGMVTPQDLVLAISYSGFTEEILTLIPLIKRLNVPLLSFTGNKHSPLAAESSISFDLSVEKEACPLGLAPTTSTTVALVMGDALAIALLQARGFDSHDFALSHPSGSLGKRILLRAIDLAHTGEALPKIENSATIKDALVEVTSKKLGMTCVIDKSGKLVGVFTDGDIRRALTREYNIHTTLLEEVMSKHCKTIGPLTLAAEALRIMQDSKITSLVIVDENNFPQGVIHMHDIIQAGIT